MVTEMKLHNIERRYNELIKEINKHNDLYYKENNPELSDFEYDMLLRELQVIENDNPHIVKENSPTKQVGSDLVGKFEKHTHEVPMLSISNGYTIEEIKDFYNKCEKYKGVYPTNYYTAEYKIDGCSISLIYKNNKLTKAVTRGNGEVGEVVTNNIKHILDIPIQFSLDEANKYKNSEIIVRGEIYLTLSELNRINKELESKGEPTFSNARNTVSGLLKRKTKRKDKVKLNAFFYRLIIDGKDVDQNKALSKLKYIFGFKVPPYEVCDSFESINNFIDITKEERTKLDYQIDGIVIKAADTTMQTQIGGTSKHPNWAIAYKYPAEEKSTKITSIVWDVGKTGIVAPIAKLNAIELGGTIVRSATLHNVDEIKRLKLQLNDTVIVKKAGEIIPKVVKVLNKNKDSVDIVIPTNCPSCNSILVQDKTALKCTNDNCKERIKEKIKYWASPAIMDIQSLGDKVISQLVDNNKIKNIFDLYKLTVSDLKSLNRVGNPLANKIIDNIEESKNRVTDVLLLAGLNIDGVGRSTSKLIFKDYKFQDLYIITKEKLQEIKGIGPIVAENIKNVFYLNGNVYSDIANDILFSGLEDIICSKNTCQIRPTENTVDLKSDKLKDLTFVVTGELKNYTRDTIASTIEFHSGSCKSSVSKNTNYVLMGSEPGKSKIAKAKELNIKIITEDEFQNLIK